MGIRGIFVVAALVLAVCPAGCTRGGDARQSPHQDVARNLVPSKAEARGRSFVIELSELKVTMKVNPASSEITQTPRLRGRYRITNTSPGAVEVQGVTIEYMDAGGNPSPSTRRSTSRAPSSSRRYSSRGRSPTRPWS